MLKRRQLAFLLSTILLSSPVLAADRTYELRIPQQSLQDALTTFARQSGLEIVYESSLVAGHTSPEVRGNLTAEQVLQRLLDGTGLESRFINAGAIALSPANGASANEDGTRQGAPSGARPGNRDDPPIGEIRLPGSSSMEAGRAETLDSVVVTGTRIRGGATPSPVITIGSERIRQEGFTDLGEVIRSVPQNFSGGQNPGVTGGDAGAVNIYNQNITGGSGLNLRGLGPDASLTLLNGRRLAYGGYAQAIDISAIPVEAVDRLDVVLDGASAIYGSDAVAGVANVVLKRDFEGLMVGMRYGAATEGGLATRELTGTTGGTWSTGGLIFSVRQATSEPIWASQRSYTEGLSSPRTIYPELESASGLVSAHQLLGDSAELRVDVLRSRLENSNTTAYAGYHIRSYPVTDTILVSPSMEFQLPGDWSIVLGGTYGKSESLYRQSTVRPTGTSFIGGCYCNDSRSYDIGAEGPLFAMPGGDARLAIGAGSRTHEFWDRSHTSPQVLGGKEAVDYSYAELNLPLAAPAPSGGRGLRRLELNAAVRREDNENFGGVTSPKLGIVYGPSADITLKTSWSRSFKAPTLEQRYQRRFSYLWNASDVGGSGYPPNATALMTYGGSEDLEAERARTWTTSLAFHPEALPGLTAELTYFDIDYTDRVVQPLGNFYQALSNPDVAEFIVLSPAREQQAALLANYDTFLNLSGAPYDPDTVVAILSGHNANAARQRIKGVDLSAAYGFDFGGGRLQVRGSASWLDSTQQTTAGQDAHEIAGTIFHPARERSRLGLVWNRDSFSASGFLSHTGGVTSRLTAITEKTASFTTLDANFRYDTGDRGDALSGLAFEFSAQNLLDRHPPLYMTAAGNAPPYDSTNYSAVGRFLSVRVTKHW